MKRAIITHTDLDGYGCAFLASKKFPEINIYHADYDNFDEVVNTVFKEIRDLEYLIISDVWADKGSLQKETFDKLTYFKGDLIVVDHHKDSEEEQDTLRTWGHTVINGTGTSATKYLADFLELKLEVVDHINTYDLSGTIEGTPGQLNTLFWYYKNRSEHLIFYLLDRVPFCLFPEETEYLQELEEEISGYYDEKLEQSLCLISKGVTYLIFEATKHPQHIAKYGLELSDCVIILDREREKTSYRSKNGEANVIAKYFGGGGHDNASGSRLITQQEVAKYLCL